MLSRQPSVTISSPFSPLFDLELESNKGRRNGGGFERCWSEYRFPPGGGEDGQPNGMGEAGVQPGTVLQQILRLCCSEDAVHAQVRTALLQ
jgi:hypothetical protein